MNKSRIEEARRPADAADGPRSEPSWPWRLGSVLVQAVKDFFHDSGPQWAAAIAYYSLLSTFPLLLATASIAAFFVDPQWVVEQATNLLNRLLPTGGNQIESTIKEAIEARGRVSFISIGTLLWTGSRVFGAVTKALNIAYAVDETYGFWKRFVVELLMVVTLGVFFVVALASRSLINLFWNRLDFLPAGQGLLFQVTREAVPALLLLIVFFLLYRFVPHLNNLSKVERQPGKRHNPSSRSARPKPEQPGIHSPLRFTGCFSFSPVPLDSGLTERVENFTGARAVIGRNQPDQTVHI